MHRRTAQWMIFFLVLAIGLSVSVAGRTEPDRKVELPDFEVDGPSPTFDLATTPLGITLLQSAAVYFRNKGLERLAQKKIDSLIPSIRNSLSGFTAGYLLRVNVYVAESGAFVVPGGEIVTSIGLGLEPVDALAEFRRVKGYENPTPSGLNNSSFYFWFVTDSKGKITARLLPKDFRAKLEDSGEKEATRRAELAAFYSAVPQDGFKSIQRAEYWSDINKRYAELLVDDGAQRNIAGLNAQMAEVQKVANEIYKYYQQLLSKIAENQRSKETPDRIAAVIGLVKSAVQLNGMFNTNNMTPVSGNGSASTPNDRIILYRRQQQEELNGTRVKVEVEISTTVDRLRRLDSQLYDAWRRSGAPVGRPGPIPISR